MKHKDYTCEPGKPKFQGGTNKSARVTGKVGIAQKNQPSKGTPKDKGVNR